MPFTPDEQDRIPLEGVLLEPGMLTTWAGVLNKPVAQIGRDLNINPSIPHLWNQAKRPVPRARVEALANAVGLTLDEMLAGSIPMDRPRPLSPAASLVDEMQQAIAWHQGLARKEQAEQRAAEPERRRVPGDGIGGFLMGPDPVPGRRAA